MPLWLSNGFQRVSKALSSLLDFLLGHSAFEAERPARRKWALAGLGVMLLAILGLAFKLGKLAGANAPEGSAAWDAALACRIAAVRQLWCLQGTALTLLEACLAFALLDRTPLGKRLWHWSPGMDGEATEAAKTLCAGLFFSAALLAFAWLNGRVLP